MWTVMGPEGALTMADKIEIPRIPRDPKPRRSSYDNVARNIEKWANSAGLQKPGNGLDPRNRHSAFDGIRGPTGGGE
jgi:hypothetical protein